MNVDPNRKRRLALVKDTRSTEAAQPGVARALLRVPLFWKILIANVAILALVTVACAVVAHRPEVTQLDFALLLGSGIGASVLSNALLLRLALSPLKRLEQTAEHVHAGDLTARVERSPLADRDLDHLAVTFNAVLDSAEMYRNRLRDIAARALNAAEEERKRVARELHDGTAQTLTALLVRLRVARSTNDDAARDHLLERLSAEIGAATEEIRHIAQGLRPPALDMLGLAPAIDAYARTITETTDLTLHKELASVEGLLTPEAELALYRIIQEALSNVARHSSAKQATIRLQPAGHNVVASIEDDGRGFIVRDEMARGGLGLFGMQERGAYVGGTVNIESEPGGGTRIRATIPVAETARYA